MNPQPATIRDFLPAIGERAAFVGQTGCGKTTLAKALLEWRPFVVVHDGKGTINWRGYKLVRRLEQLRNLNPEKYPRLIYRPDPEELADDELSNAFFDWVYRRRNTTLYIDETYSAVHGNTIPRGLLACLTRGREHRVEVWASTQRPMRIPQEFLSEAENVFAFRLQMPQDREKVEATTMIPAAAIQKLRKRHFIFTRPEIDPSGPYTLRL